jgi:RES domain-containing protein
MDPHPDFAAFSRRLAARQDEFTTRFTGEVFRFVNPAYSKVTDLFTGKGALHAHGRWLMQGVGLATYTALEPETALAESLASARYYGFPLSSATPLVLVSAQVRLSKVVDLRDGGTRRCLRVSAKTLLECDWRAENKDDQEAITQAIGRAAGTCGFEGMLVPSAARSGGANLIVFPGQLLAGSSIMVVKEVKWPSL